MYSVEGYCACAIEIILREIRANSAPAFLECEGGKTKWRHVCLGRSLPLQ